MSGLINLDRNWRFHLGDVPDAGFMMYDDSAWRRVTLPHDWAVEHPFDQAHSSGTGYLPGGTGWYRKSFRLTEEEAAGRVRVCFEGVYKHARVWINSNYLGQHAYGYISFWFDLTPFVRAGENLIAVRVEHEDTADSRWYTGSGIDRHVWLEKAQQVCFQPDGLFVSTREADGKEAWLSIQYETLGAEGVQFTLVAPDGSVAGKATAEGARGKAEMRVDSPRLWSPERPSLYSLRAETLAEGRTTDAREIPIGIRTFRFDPDQGFFLNGENMKLKGVCVHHDGGCLGAAVPKTVWERRLKKLKAMGCNAIRTAHNPPDPDLLDLCDTLGFLVMDEAFDEWEGIKNKWWQGHNVYPPKHFGYGEDFPQWHRQDLESMIRRDRNHPCVILWSIGNEIDYPNDPYVTPLFREVLGNNDANKPLAERLYDVRKPDAGRLAEVARELVGIVHELDDTRPALSALSFPELSNLTGFADALDLSGYNYREHFYEEDHAKYPGRVILGSENSHDPAAWRAVTEHDYISGQFLWTGVDFLGECRGWPVRISQAGALDLAGNEKPLYAQRKALWTDAPYARLAVGSAEEKHGAWGECFRWQGTDGEMKRVSCYTNQGEAELFLNGVSVGRKAVSEADGCCAAWEVPYAAGTLRVRAGTAEDQLSTPREAVKIRVAPERTELAADGLDVVQAEVFLEDGQGNSALDEEIHVQVLGDLEILGMENGIPDDLTPYAERFRRTKEGRLIVYLRAGTVRGTGLLRVWTASGLCAELNVTLQ